MKFRVVLNWLRVTFLLAALSNLFLTIGGRSSDDPIKFWLPLTLAAGWTIFVVGRWLRPFITRSAWMYKLYRLRSPAGPEHFARPPLPQGIFERFYSHLRPPKWCRKSGDELMIVYRDQKKLLHEGMIALGVIVQANVTLFGKGAGSGHANILYTTDFSIVDPVPRLLLIAQKIYTLKASTPEGPDELKFARMVSYEYGRDFRVTVPDSLTDGMDVTYTTIMIHRKHLPFGYLTGVYFPVLIHSESRAAMILPARYWPHWIIADWTAVDKSKNRLGPEEPGN
jgi:hypothetical protein